MFSLQLQHLPVVSSWSTILNFHPLEVVDRVSETQLQVGENSDPMPKAVSAYL